MTEAKRTKLYAVLVALLTDGYSIDEIKSAIAEVENFKILSRYNKYRNLLLNISDCDLTLFEKVRTIMSKKVLGLEDFKRGKKLSYEYVLLKLLLNFLENEKNSSTDE